MQNSNLSLEGQVALVTGAASGIGRASATALAAAGAKVVVSDVAREGGLETVDIIQAANGDAHFIECNVADAISVEGLISGTVDHFGRLDIAHNNAGTGSPPRPIHETTESEWESTMGVNLKGVWLCMRAEIAQMLKQGEGGGVVLNTASVGGLKAVPGAIYSASKHGIVGLTKAAAVDYAMQGIRVNAICPGPTRSVMGDELLKLPAEALDAVLPPMKRFGLPEEISAMVAFLCSPAASFITGQAIALDGGATA